MDTTAPGPRARIVVDAPPEPAEPATASPLARLMPFAMVAATLGMTAMYLTSGSARNPMFLFLPVMMLVSVVGTLAHGARGRGSRELDRQRAAYLRRLDDTDALLSDCAATQHRAAHHRHPPPGALWSLVTGPRCGERTATHPDHLVVRVGIGTRPLSVQLVAPQLPDDDDADPVTAAAVRRLLEAHAEVDGVPVSIDLRTTRTITIRGDPDDSRALIRAMVCQLSVFHGDHEVAVDVVGSQAARWDFVKWLPHRRRPGAVHRLLVVDGEPVPAAGENQTLVVVCGGEPGMAVTVDVDATPLRAAWDAVGENEATSVA